MRWVVDGVECDKSILFNGQELLGLSINDVSDVLGRKPDQYGESIELGDETQVLAEFDDLGLVLWMKDGISVAASIDDGDYEDDDQEGQ